MTTISDNSLNEFYKGLKLLIEFETGQSQGAMASPFYAINKVVAHFNTALEEGDVLAPFFLHYIADKFPTFVDKSELTDLSSVPGHRSQAAVWIEDYQIFLNLYKNIDELTKPRVIEGKNERQAKLNKKNLERQYIRIKTQALTFIGSRSAIGGIFAAKTLEHLQEKMKETHLDHLIVAALEKAALVPNVYAMYEYVSLLQKKTISATCPLKQKKIETELSILEKNNGDISSLIAMYQAKEDDDARYLSQWIIQSAIHGNMSMAELILNLYIFDNNIQWIHKISNKDKLKEAIKWFNWYETHAPSDALQAYWRKITAQASQCPQVIGGDINKASFLCYALDRVLQYLSEQRSIMPEETYLSQNADLLEGLVKFREIVELTWSLNNSRLPVASSAIVLNEMAIILELRHEYKQAESLYRQCYALDTNKVMAQYNLANILYLQNKNRKEQISLFFDAATKGCYDSAKNLFRLFVIEADGSIEQLEALKHIIMSLDGTEDFSDETPLLINLITTAIIQKIHETEIIKWTVTEKDGNECFFATVNLKVETIRELVSKLKVSEDSPLEASKCDDDTISITKKITEEQEIVKKQQEEAASSSHRLFKPAKPEEKPHDMLKERAFKKLCDLNCKPIRSLNLKDLIQAQKAWQVLMGDGEGIAISHKGRTSGSRASIGGRSIHLTHARDRMSIAAQKEIKDAIHVFTKEATSVASETAGRFSC